MNTRTEAAYQRVCSELGKVFGELATAQDQIAERDALIDDLRAQLARQQDQIQKEADG